jgi:hypothetical protein
MKLRRQEPQVLSRSEQVSRFKDSQFGESAQDFLVTRVPIAESKFRVSSVAPFILMLASLVSAFDASILALWGLTVTFEYTVTAADKESKMRA